MPCRPQTARTSRCFGRARPHRESRSPQPGSSGCASSGSFSATIPCGSRSAGSRRRGSWARGCERERRPSRDGHGGVDRRPTCCPLPRRRRFSICRAEAPECREVSPRTRPLWRGPPRCSILASPSVVPARSRFQCSPPNPTRLSRAERSSRRTSSVSTWRVRRCCSTCSPSAITAWTTSAPLGPLEAKNYIPLEALVMVQVGLLVAGTYCSQSAKTQ